ncbi:hypothetical protein KUTeg_000916, partial [Tegillarca granosa]
MIRNNNNLRTTLSIILDLDTSLSIIISACVAVFYTFFGGLYSVAYTDVIQLFLIAIGLILALPFAATNPNVDFTTVEGKWQGNLETNQIGIYVDLYILCICGAVPWQVYYQRVLACKTVSLARDATLVGIFMSLLECNRLSGERNFVWYGMDIRFTHGAGVFVPGSRAIGAIIAITVQSVYGLYILCGDLMMVIQFPQLTCALWIRFANTYGSALGFIVGFVLRVLGGEPLLNIPTVLRFPFYDEKLGQLFLFKTFAMLLSFITIISVSYLTEFLFVKKQLSLKYDVFNCFSDKRNFDLQSDNGVHSRETNDGDFRGQTDILLKEHKSKNT